MRKRIASCTISFEEQLCPCKPNALRLRLLFCVRVMNICCFPCFTVYYLCLHIYQYRFIVNAISFIFYLRRKYGITSNTIRTFSFSFYLYDVISYFHEMSATVYNRLNGPCILSCRQKTELDVTL